jgi:hypothetical protein
VDTGVRENSCRREARVTGSPPPRAQPAPSHIPKDTVPEEREDDEVDGEHHAALHTPLRLDPVVHDLVPVLARQDLEGEAPSRPQPHRPRRSPGQSLPHHICSDPPGPPSLQWRPSAWL